MTVSSYFSYASNLDKEASIASIYEAKTKGAPHRYLAYRDLPGLFSDYVVGKNALDFGCGTGISTEFLKKCNFTVTGVDKSSAMLSEAQKSHPDVPFKLTVSELIPSPSKAYDLVFSSFVLFELGTKNEIIKYLKEAKRVLKDSGTFISVTGSENMYSEKKWMLFDTNYPQNKHLKSGDMAKILLKGADIEFTDYYWLESDYKECFKKAGFNLMEILYPLGKYSEPFPWNQERKSSPFVIFVAKPI